MVNSLTNDASFYAARKALDGLSKRQEQIGHNLANVDTPNYRAKTTNCESALRRALEPSLEMSLTTTDSDHMTSLEAQGEGTGDFTQVALRRGGAVRADGNNVDIDVELMQASETGLRYETLTQLVNKKFNLLKQIAK